MFDVIALLDKPACFKYNIYVLYMKSEFEHF